VEGNARKGRKKLKPRRNGSVEEEGIRERGGRHARKNEETGAREAQC
jgi:hypothetical protein